MKKLLVLISFIAISLYVFPQQPPWYFFNTGVENTHIILITEGTPMTIDDEPMVTGDYIGAFYYDEFGNIKCGTGTGNTGDVGGMKLTGSVNAVTTWGTEQNVYNGFQDGEEFKWKVWRSSDGSIFDAVAVYDHSFSNIPDSQFYIDNGLSKLESLVAFSIPGIDMSVNTILTPQSGCGLTNEYISVLLQNHDTLFATEFEVSYVFMEDTITEIFTDTLQPDSTIVFTFSSPVDISVIGDYHIESFVVIAGDVNPTNDAKEKDIIVSAFPTVNIGPDSAICEGKYIMVTTDSVFSSYLWSNGGTDNRIYIYDQGDYSVTVTDDLGCQAIDSMFLVIYPKPLVDLGDDVYFCEGDYLNIYTNGNFESYHWSNNTSLPNLYISLPGTFSVTVTDNHGCIDSDTINAFVIPTPVPSVSGTIESLTPDTILDAGEGFDTYLWQNGSTSQAIHITEWGIYSVTVTNQNCTGSGHISIIPGDSAVIFSGLTIFPNPVTVIHKYDLFFLFPNEGNASLKIFDRLGRQVLNCNIEKQNRYRVDVSQLSNGVFIAELTTGSIRLTGKFVKF